MKKEQNLQNAETQALNIPVVMSFYFKINNSKLNNELKFHKQIELVIKRLIEKNNIKADNVELIIGTMDDDIVYNRSSLRISFNCE